VTPQILINRQITSALEALMERDRVARQEIESEAERAEYIAAHGRALAREARRQVRNPFIWDPDDAA
jgi:hypothetical protein